MALFDDEEDEVLEDEVDEGGADEDDDEERFADAPAAAATATAKGSVKTGKPAKEFIFQLETYTVLKAAELPGTFPSLDGDDQRGQSVFEWMIAPLSPERFFAEFWEKKPLLIKRHAVGPNYHKAFFHRTDIEAMLKSKASPDASAAGAASASGGLHYTTDLGVHFFFYNLVKTITYLFIYYEFNSIHVLVFYTDVTSYVNGTRKTHNPEGILIHFCLLCVCIATDLPLQSPTMYQHRPCHSQANQRILRKAKIFRPSVTATTTPRGYLGDMRRA
jgi:hypothetical protein